MAEINGENYVVTGPSRSVSVVLPTTITVKELSFRYQDNFSSLTAPVAKGEQLTMVQVWYNNVCIGQSPIVTKNGSVELSQSQQMDYVSEDSPLADAMTAIGIICAGILGAIAILYIYQFIRRTAIQAQHKRRRRYRRRS